MRLMRPIGLLIANAVVVLAALLSLPAWAEQPGEKPVGRSVLIVAYNGSLDTALEPLRYADDDGVLNFKMLSPFSRRIKLLSILDDQTQARNARLAPLVGRPDISTLRQTLQAFRTGMQQDARDGLRTELIFIYVGHGSVDQEGRGYLHLQDGRFTRQDLFAEVVESSGGERTHIILDACHAYSVIAGRGDGDSGAKESEQVKRALETFLSGNDLERYPNVGVLLASSDSRETHEWSRIEAGLFSHQVRSALSGAADVNRDGRLEYSEVAAFVDAANAKLPGRGERLRTFAWPPVQDRRSPLLEISQGQGLRYLVLDRSLAGHLSVESELGEAWIDLNKPAAEPVVLAVPAAVRFFLRQGQRQLEIPPGTELKRIRELPPASAFVAGRGVAERDFEEKLFVIPFGEAYYRGFLSGHPQLLAVDEQAPHFLEEEIARASYGIPFRLEAGYQFGGFLLEDTFPLSVACAEGCFEHGAFVRAGWTVWRGIVPTLAIEGGYVYLSQTRATGASRVAVLPGILGRLKLSETFDLQGGVEVGWGLIAFHAGSASSLDPSVGVVRARLATSFPLSGSLRFLIGGGWLGSLVTIEGEEAFRQRWEMQLGLVWENGAL